jgi:SNF2 family DNA or RNA helicase
LKVLNKPCVSGEFELDRFPIAGAIFQRLYPHQRKGIEWLWSLHKTRAGGILGDDMGMVCVSSMF